MTLAQAINRCFEHFPNITVEPEDGVVARFTSAASRWVDLMQPAFNGQIKLGPANSLSYDDVYSFGTFPDALAAYLMLAVSDDEEPLGWIRHQPSDRRRPDGDSAREYIWA